jgi:hypothetical protein
MRAGNRFCATAAAGYLLQGVDMRCIYKPHMGLAGRVVREDDRSLVFEGL